MDKKNLAIIILSVAFAITLIGFISASLKVNEITSEKGRFMKKIRESETLAAKLSQNINDLKASLGKTEREKENLAKEAEEIKKRLEKVTPEEKPQ